MSSNQSRADKSESSQYRKSGRFGSSGQQKNFSGSSGKGGGGGGTAPPPSSSSLPSNRSVKKSHNAQGAQSRAGGASANLDSNNAPVARTIQNGAHVQPTLQGVSDAPATSTDNKPTNVPTQKSTRTVPKAPSSNAAASVNPGTAAPVTPSKVPGDASRSFPLQFGSISPCLMNGMQIPARTSSAPPNLDEQKHDQARHENLRPAPALPMPSNPKQQLPRKDTGSTDQSNTIEVHPQSKGRRDAQAPGIPQASQSQKPAMHPMSGISIPMPFHQQQVPVQFGGSNPQIPTQNMATSSLSMQMAMSIPLPMGTPPQVQPQVFVPGLQPHPMQSQGIRHQGQNLNFSSQMGHQLPPQLGNLGMGMNSQFSPQQARCARKAVKITHPDTHEELRLDNKRSDTYMDGGSAGPRSHPNVPPQSQPMPSFSPTHPINSYPNSYNASSLFFSAQSSVPLSSTQIPPTSQAPRFYNPVSQAPVHLFFMNPRDNLNCISVNKIGGHLHGFVEPSNSEYAHDAYNVISSPSTSIQVTVKPSAGLHGEKVPDSSSYLAVGKVEPPNAPRPHGEAIQIHPPRDSTTSSMNSLQQSKPDLSVSTKIPEVSKQPAAVFRSVSAESSVSDSMDVASVAASASEAETISSEDMRKETAGSSDSIKDQQKKPGKKGPLFPRDQVGGQYASVSSLPSESLEPSNSLNCGISDSIGAKTTPASSGNHDVALGSAKESSLSSDTQVLASHLKVVCVEEGSTCKSSETSTAETKVDTSLKEGQKSNPEPAGTKERESLLPEGVAKDENGFEFTGDVPVDSSKVITQTEQNSDPQVTTTSSETKPLNSVQIRLHEPVGFQTENEGEVGNLACSTPTVSDVKSTDVSMTPSVLSRIPQGDKPLTPDASLSRHDSINSKEVVVVKSSASEETVPISIPLISDTSLNCDVEVTGNNSSGMVSPSASGFKDKPLLEPNKIKNAAVRGKKKRKEMLQKAELAGNTSDLYMAYKGPEEKKETLMSTENTESDSGINLKQAPSNTSQEDAISIEKSGLSKAEPDDWEDVAEISTPNLESSDDGKQVTEGLMHHDEDGNGAMEKKYSRDFLMTFAEHCTDLPEGFEVTVDIAEAFLASNVPRDSYPSPGRVIDRPMGVTRPDRRGSGMGDDDRWSKIPGPLASGRDMRLDFAYGGNVVGFRPVQGGNYGVLRNPRTQSPVQYVGGILSGPMQSLGSQGGMPRNSPDSDRWQRATAFQKGLIPSPQTPLQVMHKAEKKYEIGKITDEEQAKQRQLKSILNKLTPQNFEKLFEQVKQVNIDNAVTLTGVISQIFDKALMEPTFCEMYANFCHHLAGELPDLSVDNEKITFKRLLLNKCQEEFERGEREQEEANRVEGEGEAKQSEEEREEKRLRARRRMLGNIRLIGELYKKKMLTERIMHECLKKLLGEDQNPDEEDVEALCKLMSTIGEMIDHSKAKEHMDAYFDIMANLSNNMKLSSRVRFMLKDAIDLRNNKWQQRRKVEGPKKIDEVHRDAAQERQAQASRLARNSGIGSSVRRGQPMDFATRGSTVLSSPGAQMGGFRGVSPQLRGYGAQDARFEDRHSFEIRTVSVPLPQRSIGDDSIPLGPQGGLARGMSIRGQPSIPSIPLADVPSPVDSRRMTGVLNGYSSVPERTAYGSREDTGPRYIPERFSSPSSYDQFTSLDRNMRLGTKDARNADHSFGRSLPTSPPGRTRGQNSTQYVASEKLLSEERLRDMSLAAIKEFYSARDKKEVALCVKDMDAPSYHPSMISIWVVDSFDRKDMERDLLAKLLIDLTCSRDGVLSQDQLVKGFEAVLSTLEDAVNDAPKAAEFLGRIFAKVIIENAVPFAEIGHLIYEGGEERGRLVEIGLAAEVLGSVLEFVKSERGDSVLNELRKSSSLQLDDFRPPNSNKTWRLDKFI